MKPAYDSVVSITGEFCSRFLNEEYAMLCRKLTGDLSRKRPSPLVTGNPKTWACGIVYALGQVNFLFDKTQTPHISAVQLCSLFGVSKSSGANTAKRISEMMKMGPLDPRWYLPSKMGENPMAWMIEVNGFIVDARYASVEIQEEAFQRGLIPYIP